MKSRFGLDFATWHMTSREIWKGRRPRSTFPSVSFFPSITQTTIQYFIVVTQLLAKHIFISP